MVRLLAVLSIAAAFAFGGKYLAFVANEKAEIIREILQMINVIETRLRFNATPVSQLLLLIEESGCKRLGFIKECRIEIENGCAFDKAWEKSIRNSSHLCSLLPEDTKHLIAMGADIGVTDIEGQLACCGYNRQIFEKSLCEKEEKSRQSSKLFPPLGILLGISAAMFLL